MSYSSIVAQKKAQQEIQKNLDKFYNAADSKGLYSYASTQLKNFKKPQTQQDSFTKFNLVYYRYLSKMSTLDALSKIDSLNKFISLSPKTIKGDSLLATLYNSKAYNASNLNNHILAYKSIKKSVDILEKIPNPNPGYLMGGYLLLANKLSVYGNDEDAKTTMRLAEKVYEQNKKFIDNNTWAINGNNQRLGVIGKYRKISLLTGILDKAKDSIELLATMNALEKMHSKPNFNPEERIYYTTALNHIGDWFIAYKPDTLTTKKDVDRGLSFLLKALNLVENKGYSGTTWAIKYNIAKGYIRGNQLQKADSVMSLLLSKVSKIDGRLPFFWAQKGQIKGKKEQKDSTIYFFEKSISRIHSDTISLEKNYENFKPSKAYNHTRLLLRIAEELDKFFPKDTAVQKKIGRLHYMALEQFQNSYINTNFNKTQNEQLRQILKGILKSRKTGLNYKDFNKKSILNQFEKLTNQLAWKSFYESRYTNVLPNLDSVKQREFILASHLSKAKISNNSQAVDSLNRLINISKSNKKKLFPQLELLSDFQFSIDKFQKTLSSEDLVIKYVILDNEIAVYHITKNDIKIKNIPWSKKIEKEFIDFISSTQNRKSNEILSDKFSKLLLKNLDDNIKNIIINPDGILYKLPFEILKIDDEFMTSKYNVRYTSNLGFVNFDDLDNIKTKTYIYAPKYEGSIVDELARSSTTNLVGAKNEAKKISELLPSVLFNDEQLNKKTFLKTAKNANVLHLAMHADVDQNFPELSRLLFSNNTENEEEQLYLEEFYGLNLNANLAVLSACNTGVGFEKNGSVASFQRAFTFAGVPATVVSLWEVPDASTSAIMVSFYENLKTGQTKSEALKNAKLTYISNNKNTKVASPYYWAGFVVYGSDVPIVDNSNTLIYFIIISIFTIVITGFYLLKNRKKTT